jgi:hypothetical protein
MRRETERDRESRGGGKVKETDHSGIKKEVNTGVRLLVIISWTRGGAGAPTHAQPIERYHSSESGREIVIVRYRSERGRQTRQRQRERERERERETERETESERGESTIGQTRAEREEKRGGSEQICLPKNRARPAA